MGSETYSPIGPPCEFSLAYLTVFDIILSNSSLGVGGVGEAEKPKLAYSFCDTVAVPHRSKGHVAVERTIHRIEKLVSGYAA